MLAGIKALFSALVMLGMMVVAAIFFDGLLGMVLLALALPVSIIDGVVVFYYASGRDRHQNGLGGERTTPVDDPTRPGIFTGGMDSGIG
jgi:hypothetical protein